VERNSTNWNKVTSTKYVKKKSPSVRQRDQRRWEILQARKGLVPDYPPPVIGQHPPETGPQLPESGHQLPESGHQHPKSGNQLPESGHQLTESGHQLTDSDHQPPVTGPETPSIVQEEVESPFSMEVESPFSSSANDSFEENTINLSDWNEDVTATINDPKNIGNSATVTIVIKATDLNSATASLKRTLKKSNLRSIEPRRVETSPDWLLYEGEYGFQIKVINKNIKNTFFNIQRNWIIVQQSQLLGFFIKDFSNFFKNS